MQLCTKNKRKEKGYILVAVTVIAATTLALVALTTRATSKKLDAANLRENQITTKQVADNIANRITHYINKEIKTKGVNNTEFHNWLAKQEPINTRDYKINMNEIEGKIDINPVKLANKNTIKSQDPLIFGIKNYQTNTTIRIPIHSKVPNLSDLNADYTIKIQVIPISEFAVFSPIPIQNITAEETTKHIFIYGPQCESWKTGKNTSTCDPNIKKENTLFARYENIESSLLRTFNLLNSDTIFPFNLQKEPQKATNYFFNNGFQNIQNTISKKDITVTNLEYAYQIFGNDNTNIATIDLSRIIANQDTDLIFPSFNENNTVYLITNLSNLGKQNNIHITFPNNILTYLQGDINTNNSKLRIEGNLGFISKENNIFSITKQQLQNKTPITNYIPETTQTINAYITDIKYEKNKILPSEIDKQLAIWAKETQNKIIRSPGIFKVNVLPFHLPIQQLLASETVQIQPIQIEENNETTSQFNNQTIQTIHNQIEDLPVNSTKIKAQLTQWKPITKFISKQNNTTNSFYFATTWLTIDDNPNTTDGYYFETFNEQITLPNKLTVIKNASNLAESYYANKFAKRKITFHYRPNGWLPTSNIQTNIQQAPTICGRFISNSQLNGTLNETLKNFKIQGQLTIKNQSSIIGPTAINNIVVSEDKTVVPEDPDMIIDVKIVKSSISETKKH